MQDAGRAEIPASVVTAVLQEQEEEDGPSPDLLQISPGADGTWKGPVRLSDGPWAQDAEAGAAPIPEHQLFWGHLRCVSPAQVTSAALPLEGMGDIWNLQPFGVMWALLTDSYSLWTLVSHPMEYSLDPTAVTVSNNKISKWNHS